MFQTTVLASGSKGNCILIRTEKAKILLDAGLSGKKISQFIQQVGLSETKIKALLISHEHSDHIRGAGIICRKYNIPLIISEKTYKIGQSQLGTIPHKPIFFQTGDTFEIGDIIVNTFSSSHDVVDGSNFIFTRKDDEKRKLAVATDLGFSSKLMLHKLKNSTTIILESNHDEKMLLEGPYPWHLKQRVKGREGHLSNSQAVGVITKVIHPNLENLILAHLSEQNNKPEIAFSLMENYLNIMNHKLNLYVSGQYEPTPLINI